MTRTKAYWVQSKIKSRFLQKYATDNGFKNTKLFVDDGWLGTNFDRPAFNEVMKLGEAGKIGTLIVKDHSCLGRNRLVVGSLLEEEFDRVGIRYITKKLRHSLKPCRS